MSASRYLLLVLLLLVTACDSGGPTSGARGDLDVHLTVLSGGNQTGPQWALLPAPIIVQAVRSDGAPAVGEWITASVASGSGSMRTAAIQTDSTGNASFEWTLGTAYTNSVQFRANVGGVSTPPLDVTAVATYTYTPPVVAEDAWPTASLPVDDPALDRFYEGVDAVRRGDFPETHSILLAHRGKLVFEIYFAGKNSVGQTVNFTRTTPHEGQSSTKSFRSALIGMAIEKGYIDNVDQPIIDFYPEFAHLFDEHKRRITVRDLLTMSSGIQWNESGAASGGTNNNLSIMYSGPASAYTEYVLSQPMTFEPGSVFVYNTGASLMLGDIVQRASGQTLSGFVASNMMQPMEMTRLPGIGLSAGASTVPRDMAKLGQVYMDGGTWKGTRVVSADWVAESLQEVFQVGNGLGYGYQWWMRTIRSPSGIPYRVKFASGNGGQLIIIIDELDLVVTSTGGNFGSSRMNQMFGFIEAYVLDLFD